MQTITDALRMATKGLTQTEVARRVGWEVHAFRYAVMRGYVPPPDVPHGRRHYYSPAEVGRIEGLLGTRTPGAAASGDAPREAR